MQLESKIGWQSLLKDFVVPELLQNHATPQAVADAGMVWLDDPSACAAVAGRFETLHHDLRRNTAQAATDAIASFLAR